MAITRLEFTKLNSSLQVGDYVFSLGTQTNGGYTVQDASSFYIGDTQLGRVKSILEPTDVNNYYVDVELEDPTILPSTGDYFYFVKDSRVNNSGLKGYYADVKFENTENTKRTELFAVSSKITESSK